MESAAAIPHVLDEAVPKTWDVTARTKRVQFDNRDGAPCDEEAMKHALLSNQAICDVEEVEIGSRSRMTTAWVTTLFPNITRVRCNGEQLRSLEGLEAAATLQSVSVNIQKSSRRSLAVLPRLRLKRLGVRVAKIEDVMFLAQCAPVEFFGLTSWRWRDLSSLAGAKTNWFRLNLGAAESLEGFRCGILDQLWAMGCTKLRSAAGASARYVVIGGCHKFELDSLGDVDGLEVLWLYSQKNVSSLAFLQRCPSLKVLDLRGSRVRASDWHYISDHPNLKNVSFGAGASDEIVSRLARENSRLAITNWDIFFFRGEQVTQTDYHLLNRERVDDAAQRDGSID